MYQKHWAAELSQDPPDEFRRSPSHPPERFKTSPQPERQKFKSQRILFFAQNAPKRFGGKALPESAEGEN
jgi:hypothetical protein